MVLIVPTQTDIMSNAGKDFVIVFPKNENNIEAASELWIYISNKDNITNNVTVSYNLDNQDTLQNYIINNNDVIRVKIPSELELSDNLNNEKKIIRINSERDIVVYCLTKNLYTSDAYLAYPIATYGNEYLIPSWSNSMPGNVVGSNINRYSTITIASIEDDTEVTLLPKQPIQIIGGTTVDEYTFSMNKFETRIIQASFFDFFDLTGLIVKSNKHVAVFAGHERASIPENKGNRDILIEQITPLPYLGANGLITPIRNNETGEDYVLTRVIAYFDSTNILYNDENILLNSQEFHEIQSSNPVFIQSDKSVLIAQYAVSTHIIDLAGDPFLAIQAPIEQYLNNYTFISVPFEEFTEHWVNVTIHKNGINTLVLDGFPIDTILFKNISGTEYFWASISLNEGSHRIKSDSTFGILAYGYGPAISYGYTGGMKTERLLEKIMDSNLPELQSKVNCNTEITVTELNEYDSGLDKITVAESKNVNVEIKPFQKGDKTANINLSLQNPKDDGFAILNTKDVKGFERDDTVSLGGFNISSDFISYHDSISYLGFRCDTIRLKNNGKYSSTFNLYFDKNTKISVPPHFGRITLTSGQDTAIPFCVYADSPKSIEDIFTIQDDCERKNTYNVIYTIQELGTDINSKCDVELELIITLDLKSYFWGNDIKPESLMKVYNLEGAKVYSGNLMNLLDNFSKGIYFIHIFENDILTGRYVVNVD